MVVTDFEASEVEVQLRQLGNAQLIERTDVLAFLRQVGSESRRFVEAAEFSDSRPYGRRLLLKTSVIEVLVMGFRPGRVCPPHDHGGSDGLVLVCSGTAEHLIYRRFGSGLALWSQTLETKGSILDAPVDCVHAMGSHGEEPLVTLHVYWPPIDHMTIFDLDNRKVWEVNDQAGAWLPVAPGTLILCTDFE